MEIKDFHVKGTSDKPVVEKEKASEEKGKSGDKKKEEYLGIKIPKTGDLIRFVVSVALSMGIYAIFFHFLTKNDVGPLWSNIWSFILGLLALGALQSSLKTESGMALPVFLIMVIIFVIRLSAVDFSGIWEGKRRAELLQITDPTKTYKTKTVFTKGQVIKLVIEGEVYQTDGQEWKRYLGPGEHSERMTGEGNMAFKANPPATVKILY